MVRYLFVIIYFISILPLKAQNRIEPFEITFVRKLYTYNSSLQNRFLKIIRNEDVLPSPNSVDYSFITTIVTSLKRGDTLSHAEISTNKFLKRLRLANKEMNGESFFVNAFYVTKSGDTVFLTYSYPEAQNIGKKIPKHKQKGKFFKSKMNDWTIKENSRYIQFLNFCRKKEVLLVIYILPNLSREYCISKNLVYTVDNMNIRTAQSIE